MAARRRQGFTLMEMLIVVAILAILVAVAIPTFAASLDAAREAACAANRRSLKGVLSAVYMTEGESAARQYDRDHHGEYPCPSGGTITASFSDGAVTVTCDKHGGEDGAPNWMPGMKDALDILEEVSKNFTHSGDIGADYAFKNAYVKYINENGMEFSKIATEEALKKFDGKTKVLGDPKELVWVGVKMQFGVKKEMRTFLVATSSALAQSDKTGDFKGVLLYDPGTDTYFRSTGVAWNGAVDYRTLQWKQGTALDEFLENGDASWEKVPK